MVIQEFKLHMGDVIFMDLMLHVELYSPIADKSIVSEGLLF